MAETDQNKKKSPDFQDPLGVKDPGACSEEDNSDADFEFLTQAAKERDLREKLDGANIGSKIRQCEEDDLDTDTKDLFVVVDNPEKHTTTMESYITFRVTTKTSRSEFDSSEYQVRRRFNDFIWLRQRLEESQPTHLVPPLPEKHSMKRFDRFSQEFVKTRQLALQVYCSRIADHPVLSFNKHFVTFITAKQSEFQAAKKEGSGYLTRLADSFHNMSASYMMKTRPPEFVMMTEYINTFSDKLGVIDRISQRILKEQYEYLAELNEWGPIFTLWSNSEDKLSQALQAVAKAVEKNFTALQEQIGAAEAEMNQAFREYALYADAIKGVLRRRDGIQVEYEMCVEESNKKKEERDQLTKKMEMLNDKSVCADSDLKADMERWHRNKKKDFKKVFISLCDRQIEYYEKCLAAWEETIPLIQKTDQMTDADIIKEITDATNS